MNRQTMGYGDLLLIAVLGAWLGPYKILLVIFSAALSGSLYRIIKNILTGVNSNEKLPFGSFLGISSIIINYYDLLLYEKHFY